MVWIYLQILPLNKRVLLKHDRCELALLARKRPMWGVWVWRSTWYGDLVRQGMKLRTMWLTYLKCLQITSNGYKNKKNCNTWGLWQSQWCRCIDRVLVLRAPWSCTFHGNTVSTVLGVGQTFPSGTNLGSHVLARLTTQNYIWIARQFSVEQLFLEDRSSQKGM